LNAKSKYSVGDEVDISTTRETHRTLCSIVGPHTSSVRSYSAAGLASSSWTGFIMRDDLRDGSRRISPSCRTYCASRNQLSGIDSSARRARRCPLWGVKRTLRERAAMSAFDRQRTWRSRICCDAQRPVHYTKPLRGKEADCYRFKLDLPDFWES